MHVRVTARCFRDCDLKFVRAGDGPELTPGNQSSSQRNVARDFANWRKIDSELPHKVLLFNILQLDSHLLISPCLSLRRASDAQNPEEGKRKGHFYS
jgi:hypothetical protein